MPFVDINCDLGEGMPNDEALMPYISSANIACGFHAGDKYIMQRTIELCLANKVAIGAHPSYPDHENFGRTNMHLSSAEITEGVLYQVEALALLALQYGAKLSHIKPHGALYNMAAKDEIISNAIVRAIQIFDNDIILFAPYKSELEKAAEREAIQCASEVFADRTYQDDGSLTPRSEKDALIEETEKAVKQVLQMIKKRTVISVTGKEIQVKADTVCIHGDGAHAVELAEALHETLTTQNIHIQPIRSQPSHSAK